VSDILRKIRNASSHFEQLNYIYVLNDSRALVGVCNMHELLMQPPDMQIYKFMVTNVILLHLHTPEEIAIKRMLKYKIYALPVVDNKNHLLGILTLDDIAEFIVSSLP
jgi:magnesium transporter